ncbi:MAG: glycoside hydrolase family 88 protein [Verrucomicrobia bacterium]|nr:glycoside hydrolase family 88 protein [Verrucomicrobiota bacterium]
MLKIDFHLKPEHLAPAVERVFALSAEKIRLIEKTWKPENGTPVFTVAGKYTSRGWTEWTQGFQFGSAILQFDATDDATFLTTGREQTVRRMASHVSHIGVHDHGFNNISTYGNLHRLMREGRIPANEWERNFYELALKLSGAVQAARWTQLAPDLGYVYSFNGPHSLFSDTIRSMRALTVSHQLGHRLMGEKDTAVNLLHRALQHAETTARFNVYFGEGRDVYDVRGRVVHESIFNLNDGSYRCPSSQQGYSPFSTWTRGQAWIACGFAEQLELLDALPGAEFEPVRTKEKVLHRFEQVSSAVLDFWIERTPTDGIPYWDDGAPNLHKLGDWANHPADPFNPHEPVDSSAAVIAAQGLMRFGKYLRGTGRKKTGDRYFQAGLTIAKNLFAGPYLSTDPKHQGLILHSVYHRPNGWDFIPPGRKIPCGESSMWGDYHARELALMIYREAKRLPNYKFFITT